MPIAQEVIATSLHLMQARCGLPLVFTIDLRESGSSVPRRPERNDDAANLFVIICDINISWNKL